MIGLAKEALARASVKAAARPVARKGRLAILLTQMEYAAFALLQELTHQRVIFVTSAGLYFA
jgi:hypothetical protein